MTKEKKNLIDYINLDLKINQINETLAATWSSWVQIYGGGGKEVMTSFVSCRLLFYFIFLPCLSFLSCAFIYFYFFFPTPQLRTGREAREIKYFSWLSPPPFLLPPFCSASSCPAQLALALLSFLLPPHPAQSLSPTHAHKRGCWKILDLLPETKLSKHQNVFLMAFSLG